MRHAPGRRGRLVDSLMPRRRSAPISWKSGEFKRDEESFKMPKLGAPEASRQQNQQLGNSLPVPVPEPDRLATPSLEGVGGGELRNRHPPKPVALESQPLAEQPRRWTVRRLEPTIGGGFHPGIEFPYLVIYREISPRRSASTKHRAWLACRLYVEPMAGRLLVLQCGLVADAAAGTSFSNTTRRTRPEPTRNGSADMMNTANRCRPPMATTRWPMPGQNWEWCCRSRMRTAAT